MDINTQHTLAQNEGSSVKATPLYIIIHDTATPNAPAVNVAIYEKRTWNTAYVHFAVDWNEICQIGEPGYVAWGALDANPYAPVQIELCNTDNQDEFKRSYANYIELIRHYAEVYGIPLTLDAGGAGTPGIKTHAWVTANYNGDHTDPYGYLASHGISKDQLARDIANGINVAADLKNGKSGAATSVPTVSKPAGKKVAANVKYALRSINGGWLDEVTNFGAGDNGYAGVPNHPHDYLTVSVDHGSIKYRVKTAQDGWLGWVTGSNRNDLVNGAAGVTGHAITGVQIVYNTPTGETYQQAYYRSQTTQRAGWLGVCADDGSVTGFDSWAGEDGEPLDRLQIKISAANPF